MKFIVTYAVPCIDYVRYEVEAESEEDARKNFNRGEGEYISNDIEETGDNQEITNVEPT